MLVDDDISLKPNCSPMCDHSQVCERCGRPKCIKSMMHSRLHGYSCYCGSQTWRPILPTIEEIQKVHIEIQEKLENQQPPDFLKDLSPLRLLFRLRRLYAYSDSLRKVESDAYEARPKLLRLIEEERKKVDVKVLETEQEMERRGIEFR